MLHVSEHAEDEHGKQVYSNHGNQVMPAMNEHT